MKPKEVGEFYDRLDDFYSHQPTLHLHHGLWLQGDETRAAAKQNLARWVADQLVLKPGEHCIDIGSGYAETARLLSRERKIHVTAVTNSSAQHARAMREATSEHVEHHLCDWCSNDLPSSEYDAAWAIESLEHMEDLDQALWKCQQVLKPSGRLIALSWLAGDRLTTWKNRIFSQPIASHNKLAALRTESEVLNSLYRAGFYHIRTYDLTQQVWRTWMPTPKGISQQLGWHKGDILEPSLTWVTTRTALAYMIGAMRYTGIAGIKNP